MSGGLPISEDPSRVRSTATPQAPIPVHNPPVQNPPTPVHNPIPVTPAPVTPSTPTNNSPLPIQRKGSQVVLPAGLVVPPTTNPTNSMQFLPPGPGFGYPPTEAYPPPIEQPKLPDGYSTYGMGGYPYQYGPGYGGSIGYYPGSIGYPGTMNMNMNMNPVGPVWDQRTGSFYFQGYPNQYPQPYGQPGYPADPTQPAPMPPVQPTQPTQPLQPPQQMAPTPQPAPPAAETLKNSSPSTKKKEEPKKEDPKNKRPPPPKNLEHYVRKILFINSSLIIFHFSHNIHFYGNSILESVLVLELLVQFTKEWIQGMGRSLQLNKYLSLGYQKES